MTASGQTVEDAVQSALKQLNTTEDQVTVDIIDEGKRGLLGLFGNKPAIVKVSVIDNPVQKAEKYLQNVVNELGIDATIETTVKGNVLSFDLSGEKIAILIGKRGQTLNAVQYLLQLVVNRSSNQYYTVVLDAEGYRNRREETLIGLANRLAVKAIKSQKAVSLEPMPSFERKVIHTALQSNKQVSTYSDGNEPNRYVVIKPK